MANRRHRGFSFLIAVVVVLAVHLLDFKGSVPDFRQKSGGGELFDIRPSFSEDEIYKRLDGYGEEGRRVYWYRNLTVDVVLPLALLHFMIPFALAALAADSSGRWPRLVVLSFPIAYVAFDLAENFAIAALVSRYPERVHVLALVLPYVTVVKRTASILALVVPLALFATGWSRRRFRSS